jgi:hypothetical protein
MTRGYGIPTALAVGITGSNPRSGVDREGEGGDNFEGGIGEGEPSSRPVVRP